MRDADTSGGGRVIRARGWGRRIVLAVAGLLLGMGMGPGPGGWGGPRSRGHDGPEHTVEELTARMAEEGETAARLLDRAVELVVLGRLSEAERDLELAVRLDPESRDALRELARLQAQGGRPEQGEATVDRALRLPGAEPVERGALWMVRAEIRARRGRLREAVEDCDAAIRGYAGNPEWYLRRSAWQRRLGWNRKRLAGLEAGWRATGAGVLVIERIEALIDAGRHEEALARIEPELRESRVRAGWLVRRARARLGMGRVDEAGVDLKEALAELEIRLSAGRPDPGLLLDRALAQGLSGDSEGANRSLDRVLAEGGGEAEVSWVREVLAGVSGRSEAGNSKKSGLKRHRGVEK